MVTRRILIVDDEPLIRHSLSAAFQNENTCVHAAPCGKDGLALLDRIVYDLCILDINLPDMSGLDIMENVKEASPATKIVIMTAGVVDSHMMRRIQVNANLLAYKPFKLDRLKRTVEEVFAQGADVCYLQNPLDGAD